MVNKYDLSGVDSEPESKKGNRHEEIARRLDNLRKLDEDNPMERAIKFDAVKHNPPKPGYMKVDVFEGEDENGERVAISRSKNEEGEYVYIEHDPIATVDLNTTIRSDVAACPSHVMPQLIDEHVQIALDEKKEHKPEKRKDEFNWWWIVFFLLMTPGILLVILLML